MAFGLMVCAFCCGVQAQKSAPPDDKTKTQLLKALKEVHVKAYADTRTGAKVSLARELLRDSRQEKGSDPAGRFVRLDQVRELALQGRHIWMAYEAASLLGRSYDIDELGMKLEIVRAAAGFAREPDLAKDVVRMGTAVSQQMLNVDRYDDAIAILGLMRGTANRTRDRNLANEVAGLNRDAVFLRNAYRRIQTELKTLETNAGDSQALAEVGRFYGVVKGHWDEALPMLAKSNDEALAELAKRDLASPKDPDAQVALGNDWWDAAQTAKGMAKANQLDRARYWYELALPKIKGLQQKALATRVASAGAIHWADELYDPGLRGHYYNGTDKNAKLVSTRIDTSIDFDWASDGPMRGVKGDWFRIIWVGCIRVPADGYYRFSASAKDDVKVYIDGHLVVGGGGGTAHGSAFLFKGLTPMRVSYREYTGDASLLLRWGPESAQELQPLEGEHIVHPVIPEEVFVD